MEIPEQEPFCRDLFTRILLKKDPLNRHFFKGLGSEMASLCRMVSEGGATTIRQDDRGAQEGCDRRFVKTKGVVKIFARHDSSRRPPS